MPKAQYTIHVNLKQKFWNRQSPTEFKSYPNQPKTRLKKRTRNPPKIAWKNIQWKVRRVDEPLKMAKGCNWDK